MRNKNSAQLQIVLITLIILVSFLLFGDAHSVFATTPPDSTHGVEKPEDLILFLPWAENTTAYAYGNGYGIGYHTDNHNQYYAIDFNLTPENTGMKVYPARQGNVIYAGFWTGSGFGNTVIIRHDIGDDYYYYSQYAHLADNSLEVTGNRDNPPYVNRNQALGKEGKTGGTSTGEHLHFSVTRCKNSTDIWVNNFPSGLLNDTTNCDSVVPEPLIGKGVYEGFGLSSYSKNISLIGANPGSDNPSGPPLLAKWAGDTVNAFSTISSGQQVRLSIESLPHDTKEVRITAWYQGPDNKGWSKQNNDLENQNWRILARCWQPKVDGSNPANPGHCNWSGLAYSKLTFDWSPYNENYITDAPWLPSGSDVYPAYKNTLNKVCISFDVFDTVGNAVYAPNNGILCNDAVPPEAQVSEFNLNAVSSVAVDSARLIYLSPVYSYSNDNTPPTGSWSTPSNGQTISSSSFTLSVNASDNAGGSGVREVRWAAKYNGQWFGIGTDYDSPYSITWDWCKAGAQNGDVELGFEVWDNANNKWVYSEHAPAGNIHINKSYNCDNGGGGSITWSTHFYNGMDHWWDPNNTSNQMCSGSFSQGNLDQNYGSGSPCGGATDNWVGDYKATVNFLPGYYAFWVDHDDWLKLRVDGREIYSVNGVHSEWKCVDNGYMYLSGNHDIWAILAEQGGDARIKVEWSKSNGVCDLPTAFSKSSPLNGLGDQTLTPTLSWGAAGGADSYSYCINTTNDNSCAVGGNVGTATSVTLNSLSPGTTYYWQVKAYSKGGAGTEADGGTWSSFTTRFNPPDAFNKIGPAIGSNLQSTNLELTWDPSNGAYLYQYCFDATNNNICDGDMWYSAGSDTTAQITNLAYDTLYYWQVRAINGGGITNSSGDFWSFKTKAQPLTFYSSATNDGWVAEYFESSNFGGSMNSTLTTLRLGDNAGRKQYRSILSFETGASIPDNAVITKVTLKLMQQRIIGGGNPVVDFQGFMVDMRRGTFGTSPLKISDWQANANKTFGPYTPTLTEGWYTFNLIRTRAYINKLATGSGLTQIRLRFQLDDNDDAVANYLSLYSGNAGAASRPQLIIEYYVP